MIRKNHSKWLLLFALLPVLFLGWREVDPYGLSMSRAAMFDMMSIYQ